MYRATSVALAVLLIMGVSLNAVALCENYEMEYTYSCTGWVDGVCVSWGWTYEPICTPPGTGGGGGGGGTGDPEPPDPPDPPTVTIVRAGEAGYLDMDVQVTTSESAELILYVGGTNYGGVPVVPGTETVWITGPSVSDLSTTTFSVQACLSTSSCGTDSITMNRYDRSTPSTGTITVRTLLGDTPIVSSFGHRFAHDFWDYRWTRAIYPQATRYRARSQSTLIEYDTDAPLYNVSHIILDGWFTYYTPSPCSEYVPGVPSPYDLRCSESDSIFSSSYEVRDSISNFRVYTSAGWLESPSGDLELGVTVW